jgi:hypothetical protein
MAYEDSTSAQRVELLRCMEILSNLTRRVTIGSGNMGSGTGGADTECLRLVAALSAMGYGGGSVGPNQYVLTDDEYFYIYPDYPDTGNWYQGKARISQGVITEVGIL